MFPYNVPSLSRASIPGKYLYLQTYNHSPFLLTAFLFKVLFLSIYLTCLALEFKIKCMSIIMPPTCNSSSGK